MNLQMLLKDPLDTLKKTPHFTPGYPVYPKFNLSLTLKARPSMYT